MKLALVDAHAERRHALRRALDGTEHVVVWEGRSGSEARSKLFEERPDIVLLSASLTDVRASHLTREVVAGGHSAVLLLSEPAGGNSAEVYEAMGAGALDVVVMPSLAANGTLEGELALVRKLQRLGQLLGHHSSTRDRSPSSPTSLVSVPPLIAIGASTGGPQALQTVLSSLPRDFAAAVVIVQHVDKDFASGFASWLAGVSGLQVAVAQNGSRPVGGQALLAGAEEHLVMTRSGHFRYTAEPKAAVHRPSIDVLFSSLATHWPSGGAAVLMTGMGRDGAEGLKRLRQAGWLTIAQDESTSVIFGMPKAAAQLGAACKVLPLDSIATALTRFVGAVG